MGMDRDNDWCILRTSGRHTLGLAASLAADGYDVWTPTEEKTVRVPRGNVKRKVRLPIMPSYVFARASHLVDLLQLAAMPVKPRRGARCMEPAHASFTVLHAFGRIPMVADCHLNELRKLEAKRTPVKRAAYSFPRSASAKVNCGVFGGMVGVVVRSTPAATVLRFDGGFPVELPTTMLDVPVEDMEKAA
jgi:transcription antitermination factor NusG